jgi:hypothetical protein
MRGWGRRTEDWLIGLRTWQFLLAWCTATIVTALGGVTLGEWLLIGHFNPSAVLGSAAGTTLASIVTAFAARDRMREKAQQRARGTAGPPRPGTSGRA